MSAFRIHGYVIVSAEGMLADASGTMPDALKFDGDHRFFSAGLDRVDLVVHGRNSFEDQPNSPLRRRLIVTRGIDGLADDPTNPKATLWNPAGASFEDACAHAGVRDGLVAVIGGPVVFGMFMDRFDTFWLSQAPNVHVPDGEGCFPGVPAQTPQQILESHGLVADGVDLLDAEHNVTVTAWRRQTQRYTSP
ncbi:MAG: dihydrofolate reductase [Tardiphaga sp.]